jgi:hypothetical protein
MRVGEREEREEERERERALGTPAALPPKYHTIYTDMYKYVRSITCQVRYWRRVDLI